eukprot:Transcript_25529.p1 GENE.Transcript_25529~~Transcript_25529.p1  ORF type:complete len:483 (+),score=80.11 Transcript_25529:52-1449(+)
MSEEESELAAVFFCEFDNSVGRTLAFQEPAGFISADAFDAISEFLIPKPQLCGRLLVLREEGRVVLCWPVCIEDPRYARNALLFSLGFVLEPGTASGAPERYGRVLEKASRHLEVLEKESRLLSGGSREVQHMLPQLLHDLRKHGRCSIAADASNTLELSLPQPLPARPAGSAQIGAQDHMTPLLVAEPDAALVRGWDLTLQRLLPQLDGTVACVACPLLTSPSDVRCLTPRRHAHGGVRRGGGGRRPAAGAARARDARGGRLGADARHLLLLERVRVHAAPHRARARARRRAAARRRRVRARRRAAAPLRVRAQAALGLPADAQRRAPPRAQPRCHSAAALAPPAAARPAPSQTRGAASRGSGSAHALGLVVRPFQSHDMHMRGPPGVGSGAQRQSRLTAAGLSRSPPRSGKTAHDLGMRRDMRPLRAPQARAGARCSACARSTHSCARASTCAASSSSRCSTG